MYKRTLKKSTVKNIHKFSSKKCGEMIVVESSLEYDSCFHFEFSKQIILYEAQPIGFQYELCGKIRSYTPDFLVTLDGEEEIFYEVKPFCKTLSEEFNLEFEAKKIAALNLGKKLELITEKQIRIIPLLNNLKLIHRYQRLEHNLTSFQKQLLKLITSAESLTLSYLIDNTQTSFSEIIPHIADLLAKGILESNLLKPLECDSNLYSYG
tara:strand:- start:632 stop:1258 length:627 start_codon:yes stop_codon:yes gene_type:complete